MTKKELRKEATRLRHLVKYYKSQYGAMSEEKDARRQLELVLKQIETMPSTRGIKDAIRSEIVEWYVDCPYCGSLISDNNPTGETYDVDLTEGNIVACPECNKKFRVRC